MGGASDCGVSGRNEKAERAGTGETSGTSETGGTSGTGSCTGKGMMPLAGF